MELCEQKDANYKYLDKSDECDATTVGKNGNEIYCTRPKGHEGQHHAHGLSDGECAGVWD